MHWTCPTRSILARTSLSLLPRTRILNLAVRRALSPLLVSYFSTTPSRPAKPLPPLPPLLDSDITETFVKGTGPGGQVINKTSSAVQIKHHPTGIVVKNQSTRSRAQNRTAARRILRLKIEELYLGDQARTKVKEAAVGRKKRSGEKKRRRKYRALSSASSGQESGEDGEEDEDDEEEEDEEGAQGSREGQRAGEGTHGSMEGRSVGGEKVEGRGRVLEVRADRAKQADGKGGGDSNKG